MKFLLFSAPWCQTCHEILPQVDSLAKASGFKLQVVRIDTEEGNKLRMEYLVGALPTLVVLVNEKALASFTGSPIPKSLESFLIERGYL